jgi:hypothetical protein
LARAVDYKREVGMKKTKKLIYTSIVLFFCGVFYLYAQKPQENQPDLANPEYFALERKFDLLASDVRKTNTELLKKLDRILSNQQKILDELAIVKVRASRR